MDLKIILVYTVGSNPGLHERGGGETGREEKRERLGN